MKLPIIYVRGFAGGTPGIDRAVDDPFYGFNEGSVGVRVGGDSQPHFHQFEGPLLRLILEDGYELYVRGSQRAYLDSQPDGSQAPASIWVHRFYDASASTLGRQPEGAEGGPASANPLLRQRSREGGGGVPASAKPRLRLRSPEDFVLERAAEDLFAFVRLVLAKTGAARVHLVAHSMGGLICRSMIQRVIPESTGRRDGAVDYVHRLFTYGTPHGGVEFAVGFGVVEKLRDLFDINGAEIFGPDRMYQYLTPDLPGAPRAAEAPPGWRPEEMPADGFPTDRVFCLVGTNPEDYGVAMGLSAKAVGARSDGLVQIENAYVPGAHRAFIHRSHSGRYGMVNSEEGYQNLRRFLFGDLRVDVELANLRVHGAADDEIVWQLETQLAIRGLPILMHEQSTAHHCPIQVEWQRTADSPDTPLPLLTTFLASTAPRPTRPSAAPGELGTCSPRSDPGSSCARTEELGTAGGEARVPTIRHALRLRLISLREEGGAFGFSDHLEQTADFDDTLVVDIAPAAGQALPRAWAVWNSLIPGAIRDWQPHGDPLDDTDPGTGVWRGYVRVPPSSRSILGPDAGVAITVTARS